jgi:mono/diheme cytochrome c family protein
MRGSLLHRLLSAALATATAGASPVSAQESAASLKRGEALLTKNCARCHATGTAGLSPHPAAPPFRTLARKYPIDGLQEALNEGLSVGHPDMPEFVFDPGKIGAILTYLKSIQER